MDASRTSLDAYRVAFLPEVSDDITALATKLAPPRFEIVSIPIDAPDEKTIRILSAAQYVMGFLRPLGPAIVNAMSHILLVQLLTSGYDHFNIRDLLDSGITVAHVGGSNARSVAEHTLMLMLALMKKLAILHQSVISGRWRDATPSELELQELSGRTIGLLGLGRVGREVARLLRGFETTTFYYDREGPFPALDEGLGVRFLGLEEMLATVDVLSIHVPLGQTTYHLIDQRRLGLMKPSAVLVNTSRGGIVDEAALLNRLAEDMIAGVGLDVFSEEPIREGHPILSFRDRVVLTPHRAGSTEQSWDRRLRTAFENMERVCAGLPPLWTINLIQPS